MSGSRVRALVGEPVATIVLDCAERHNALDFEALGDLESAVSEALEHPATRVLLVSSSAPGVFSTGADLARLSLLGPDEMRRFAVVGAGVIDRLAGAPIPTVAAVSGLTLGGGWEIALACDLIYASEQASFGFPEVRHGLIPAFGGGHRLAALVGRMRALELMYTARTLRARAAHELGAILEVLPAAQLPHYARSVAERIAAMSPAALSRVKETMRARAPSGDENELAAEL